MPKGRPALSGVAKLGLLQIRHTNSERALLDEAAALASKPTSTWARDILIATAKATTAKQPATKKSPGTGKKPKA